MSLQQRYFSSEGQVPQLYETSLEKGTKSIGHAMVNTVTGAGASSSLNSNSRSVVGLHGLNWCHQPQAQVLGTFTSQKVDPECPEVASCIAPESTALLIENPAVQMNVGVCPSFFELQETGM
jgi:hypothetical protein